MALFRSSLALSLVLAGCGGGGGQPSSQGTRETWVVSAMRMPTDSTSAGVEAFDLDGNGTVDNQLGAVLGAVVDTGTDVQSGVDAAIATGAVVELVETGTGASTSVAFHGGTPGVAPCASPQDVVCGRHLDGSTSFTAEMDPDAPLVGSGTADAFTAGPGNAHLVLPLFGGGGVVLPLVKARVSLVRSGARLTGKIGGGVPADAVSSIVLPAMATWIQAVVARDCPGGACAQGSQGQELVALFDTNRDGAVTVAELQASGIIATLTAPDLDTDQNGVPDALSFGVGLELVGARF
jgi:hypothetical protein